MIPCAKPLRSSGPLLPCGPSGQRYHPLTEGRKMASSDAWTVVIRLFTWTPQVLWALGAAVLLRQGMQSLVHRKASKWPWVFPLALMLLAYGMVLLMIGLQMKWHGLPPFPPAGGNPWPDYAGFWEEATPSLWALPGLGLIHIFCWLENLTLARALLAKTSPPSE